MNPRIKRVFLILVIFQGLHSIEEYVGKLWEVFPPATALSGLISENLETGFLIINIGLFVFGILCWAFSINRDHSSARGLMGFWVILEIINGIGHPIWAIVQLNYTPGLITAPFLLYFAISLIRVPYHKAPTIKIEID